MRPLFYLAAILCALIGISLWLVTKEGESDPVHSAALPAAMPLGEPIQPIPFRVALDAKKVVLGEKLFNEPRLSRDNSISCASCHNLLRGGVDGKARSVGINGALGSFNAPTVFNSGFNFRQFWDGRAATLEDQIDGPIQNPLEMASNWNEIVEKLRHSPDYATAFKASYSDGVQISNIKDAIATFERSLNTPNSRFDRFLLGESQILNSEEKEGYQLFKSYGCVRCHQGINIGGNLFQKFGVIADPASPRRGTSANSTSENRAAIPQVFKVPSLRNVALTAPYFHGGSTNTLEEAVEIMGQAQLGRELSTQEVNRLVRFLNSLTGEYKGSR
jgi:cytochrome c peroxidase